MTSNNVGETKMEDMDLHLKQEDSPLLASQCIHDALGMLPGTSRHDVTNLIESHTLDQCRTSHSRLNPPSANVQSIDQMGYVVTESKVEKFKTNDLDIVGSPYSKNTIHLKQGHWSHFYKLADRSKNKSPVADPLSRAKNKLMVSVRENFRKEDADLRHLRHLDTKHIDESGGSCADVMNGKNPTSESALLPQDARLKILSTSSFSRFFGKQTSKGKSVICGHPGEINELGNGGNFQKNQRLVSGISVASGAKMPLLQHNREGIPFHSDHDGLNLRQWLRPGNSIKNKVQGLKFFRQIVEQVNVAHSHGIVLQHLLPSYFIVMNSDKLKYIGLSTRIEAGVRMSPVRCKKRPPEEDIHVYCASGTKQQKLNLGMKFENPPPVAISRSARIAGLLDTNYGVDCLSGSDNTEHKVLSGLSHQSSGMEKSLQAELQLEEKWYACPEELGGKSVSFASNIYSLGVLLFELLCPFSSLEAHSAAMFDIQNRILPPLFLSESPKEAGFCLWLIHPEPSSRPTVRDLLLSDLFGGAEDIHSTDELASFTNDDDMDKSELLLDFLGSLKEQKQDNSVSLVEDIRCIEADIKGLEGKFLSSSYPGLVTKDCSLQDFMNSVARSGRNETKLLNNMSQLEKAYFSLRSPSTVTCKAVRADRDLLKNREAWSQAQKHNEVASVDKNSADGLGVFFEGLCKFTCYSKFELRGTLRNGDLLNSANVICSLSFDRDEDYVAVAGASKKIQIFEFPALVNNTIDVHYPVIEMGNKSKLSSISWNSYIRNYLASADYDGVVQVWDAGTGLAFSQHVEHQKRAWSVDFSKVDPTKFASGSDDCSVKLWCTNEKRSTSTIWSPANVCCVQFSPYSSHLLAFGSADYKIYGYDLRHTRIPWCTLAGHQKAVSHVKFADSETLVSASTDNTLKLWDLNKTSLSRLSSDACHLTYSGHANKKHFVGLSVRDGYIVCGSESNEVFTYYRSMPMPITSYKFSPLDPVGRHVAGEDNGLFVSSVCWRSKSNMVVAANSAGSIRLLQLV